jgi:long-chain acyl-CoA synthetase
MSKKPPFTIESPRCEPVEGETIPRRNINYAKKLQTQPDETIQTVFDIVKRSAQKFGNARCMGSRDLIKIHNETKRLKRIVDGREQEVDKEWTYFELSGYRYLSFSDFEMLILQVGAGLRKLGLEKGDRVHLYAATRYGSPPSHPVVGADAGDS